MPKNRNCKNSLSGRNFPAKRDAEKQTIQVFETLEVDPKLCPPLAFGFNFDTKHWCKFYVENLSEVNWMPNAMDQLIIDVRQKRLITSRVTAHEFPDRARNEAKLKGKGLIVLLHGTPGSGKPLPLSFAPKTPNALF